MIAILVSLILNAHADYPPNNFQIPVEAVTSSRTSESDFWEVIVKVQGTHKEIVRNIANCTLKITGNWKDGTVNAYASRKGSTCRVRMFGGFARVPQMDKFAFAGIACHEVCHHIGGYPTYNGVMSCEGQSDYCAQTCLERVYPGRALAAGLVLGNVLALLQGADPVSYDTPDPTRVRRTYCSHPQAQCRTDTYLAGIQKTPRPRCWFKR